MSEKRSTVPCAPTLADLKTASSFRFARATAARLRAHLAAWNEALNPKGIFAIALQLWDGRVPVYVHRRRRLNPLPRTPGAVSFLRRYGYVKFNADACLWRLRERMGARAEFPHEIGVFLAYPLDGGIGFIENGGKNSKRAGCWKGHGDETSAKARSAPACFNLA